MNIKQTQSSLAQAAGSGTRCAVQFCKADAICELAIRGYWYPMCLPHSRNRLMPRRPLSPNTELSSGGPADNRQQKEQAARRLLK